MLKPIGGYFVNTLCFANWCKMYFPVFFLEKHRVKWIFRIILREHCETPIIIACRGWDNTKLETEGKNMNNDVARLIGIAIAAIETIGGGTVNPNFLREIGVELGKYREAYEEAYALATIDLEDMIADHIQLAVVATRTIDRRISLN